MLMHTIHAFHQAKMDIEIIVVLPVEHVGWWTKLIDNYHFNIPHKITGGGEERFFSVKNGLAVIKEEGLIAVHDGARPVLDPELIKKAYSAAEAKGAVIPVTPAAESVRMIDINNEAVPVDRNKVRMVQTPQVFRSEILKEAYNQPFTPLFTDDASVVESAGHKVTLIQGSTLNIKVTNPEDIAVAETLLQLRKNGTDR